MIKTNQKKQKQQKTYSKNEVKSILLQILQQYEIDRQNKIRQILEKQSLLLKQQIIAEIKQKKEAYHQSNHFAKFQSRKNQKISKDRLIQLKKQQQARGRNNFTNQKSKQILQKMSYVPVQDRVKDIINYKQYNMQKLREKQKQKQQEKLIDEFEQYLLKEQNRYSEFKSNGYIRKKFNDFMQKKPNINQNSKKIAQNYHSKTQIQNLNVFQRQGEYSKEKNRHYNHNKTNKLFPTNYQQKEKKNSFSPTPKRSQKNNNQNNFLTPQKKKQKFKMTPSQTKKKYKEIENILVPSISAKFIGGRDNRDEIVENLMRENRQKVYSFFQNIHGRSYLYHY